MKKLLIVNNVYWHFEIIESVIVKHKEIMKIDSDEKIQIYLKICPNKVFIKYIKTKYPNVVFSNIDKYDYYINCTIYDKDYNNLNTDNNSNKKYISHEMTPRLKKNPNVYFLSPFGGRNFLYCDILPFSNEKRQSKKPIYVIQGNLNHGRRCLPLLIKILQKTYKYDFVLKMIGRGKLPKELIPYEQKIILKHDLNFLDYHKEFSDAYCILPLITKKSHPQYYTKKLTSTINYAKGYDLKCLIDKDLQNIYNLKNVEVFDNIDSIVPAFEKTLEDFYKE
jgi:hypothetical protein